MPRPSTQVTSGLKGAVAVEDTALAKQNQERAETLALLARATKERIVGENKKRSPGEKITFRSTSRRFRLQVRADEDTYAPGSKKKIRGASKVAKFDEYTLTTSDDEIIDAIVNYHGFGVTVFDTRDLEKMGTEREAAMILEKIEASPAVRARVLRALEGTDFPMEPDAKQPGA
jgi:hypothetical protein